LGREHAALHDSQPLPETNASAQDDWKVSRELTFKSGRRVVDELKLAGPVEAGIWGVTPSDSEP